MGDKDTKPPWSNLMDGGGGGHWFTWLLWKPGKGGSVRSMPAPPFVVPFASVSEPPSTSAISQGA